MIRRCAILLWVLSAPVFGQPSIPVTPAGKYLSGGFALVRGKADMQSTGSLPESTTVPRRATGYMRRNKEWLANVDTLPYRGMSAGGGYSTVGDLMTATR